MNTTADPTAASTGFGAYAPLPAEPVMLTVTGPAGADDVVGDGDVDELGDV